MDSLLLLASFLGLAGSLVLIGFGAVLLRKARRPSFPSLPKPPSLSMSKATPEEQKQSLIELLHRTEGRLEGKES